MWFDGFVSRLSPLAAGLAAACLALALVTSSVIVVERLEAALCAAPTAIGLESSQG